MIRPLGSSVPSSLRRLCVWFHNYTQLLANCYNQIVSVFPFHVSLLLPGPPELTTAPEQPGAPMSHCARTLVYFWNSGESWSHDGHTSRYKGWQRVTAGWCPVRLHRWFLRLRVHSVCVRGACGLLLPPCFRRGKCQEHAVLAHQGCYNRTL